MNNLHPAMQQALKPFAPQRPQINDDDVYIIDIQCRTIVRHVGSMKTWRNDQFPVTIGQAFVSGRQAKGLL